MLVWLDGKSNTKAKPQENFGREVMELFTVGVGHYTEPDVYAAARVFTGWNLRPSRNTPGRLRGHERVSGVRLQRRPARHQRQDVLVPDLQQRQPDHPGARRVRWHAGRHRPDHRPGDRTRRRRAGWPAKFWNFFVSEIHPPDPAFVESAAAVYLQNGTEIRPVVRLHPHLALVQRSVDALRALFVAGGIRRARDQRGRLAEPLARQVRSPLANMGMLLFEPPNVGGWPLGADWFSTGTMLARTNFAATLASSQKEFLAAALEPKAERRRPCSRRCSIA